MSLFLSLISLTIAISLQIYRFSIEINIPDDKHCPIGIPAECIAIILEVIVWIAIFRKCLILI